MPAEKLSDALAGDDALAEANDAGTDLLRLYEALGVVALLVTIEDGAIVVRCQNADDVPDLVARINKEYEAPAEGRVLN